MKRGTTWSNGSNRKRKTAATGTATARPGRHPARLPQDDGRGLPGRRHPRRTSALYAAGSDTIRVGVIGCGGRGTGAAIDCLNSSPGRRDRGPLRPVPGPHRRAASRRSARRSRPRSRSSPRPLLHRASTATRSSSPSRTSTDRHGRPARLPADPPQGRGRGGQERLHGEAGGRRPGRHPLGHRLLRARRAEGPGHRRRHPAPPPEALPRDHEAHPRRRDRRDRRRPVLLEPGRPLGHQEDARDDRDGVAVPQLALLHLALGRPHRRAARPQHRRHELGLRRDRRSRSWAWAAARSARRPSTATSSTTSPSSSSTRTACAS